MTLVRTADILADLGRARGAAATPVLVGFAAETGDPRPRARQKLASKQIDLIVANDVSREDAGFDVNTNAAYLISSAQDRSRVDDPRSRRSPVENGTRHGVA
jgi:phosphopantothenoylcysteine decarboxylase/phosphopantothenate--cysteine ligase